MLNQQSKNQAQSQNTKPAQPKRPNEKGAFDVQAHMRIFDPKTKQVYVEGRA